jgi:hypothetical protein
MTTIGADERVMLFADDEDLTPEQHERHRYALAVHEAGHVVVGHAHGGRGMDMRLYLNEKGRWAGVSRKPIFHDWPGERGEAAIGLRFDLAGSIAERHGSLEATTADTTLYADILIEMFERQEQDGVRLFGDSCPDAEGAASCALYLTGGDANQARELLAYAAWDAREIVLSNWATLLALAELLLEFDELGGYDVDALTAGCITPARLPIA